MIINKKPLTLAEARSFAHNLEKRPVLEKYFKTFTTLSEEKAEKLKEELFALNNPKLKEETIVKIVDVLPENAEDLNKICTDASLTEEESHALLTLVKN